MSKVKRKLCETCGDEFVSVGRVCSDCLREEEVRAAADEQQWRFHNGIDAEALQQLEFIVTKCALCEQYYGPYSMEKHLREDHAVGMNRGERNEIRNEAYSEGYSDGQADREEHYEWDD
jgi:uncharacterized OB-fold protein